MHVFRPALRQIRAAGQQTVVVAGADEDRRTDGGQRPPERQQRLVRRARAVKQIARQQDKIAASALALIADIKIEDFAREMFKAGSNLKDKAPEEIFYQDYKKFIAEGNVAFGVGQISSMDEEELQEIKVRLKPFMVSGCGRHGITRVYFMLTNIMDESSDVIYYGEGSEEMGKIAFQQEPEDKCFHLKGVVSRKKQMIPAMMEAAQIMANDFN